jgi:hypothetical protein
MYIYSSKNSKSLITTLKVKDTTISISGSVHNDSKAIEYSYSSEGNSFCVSPIKISQIIISTIESDFHTFEGTHSTNHPLGDIDPMTGKSGYNKNA